MCRSCDQRTVLPAVAGGEPHLGRRTRSSREVPSRRASRPFRRRGSRGAEDAAAAVARATVRVGASCIATDGTTSLGVVRASSAGWSRRARLDPARSACRAVSIARRRLLSRLRCRHAACSALSRRDQARLETEFHLSDQQAGACDQSGESRRAGHAQTAAARPVYSAKAARLCGR